MITNKTNNTFYYESRYCEVWGDPNIGNLTSTDILICNDSKTIKKEFLPEHLIGNDFEKIFYRKKRKEKHFIRYELRNTDKTVDNNYVQHKYNYRH